ncbi:FGGY-family carbohydrate kinase [Chthonobacter albigriseus]|uniref:FGGY-family carbohydrate kinase n=1 Tax=Chthonobacter albigriseus TaxID=1683161 RepID=UPI0015EE971E|nr:FGGY family carbohydrate kinase [Chthonobacter albigriseus]
MAYVIGIDGGTESLRAHVFDLEGRPRGSHATPYQTAFPEPGRAEQNPDDWWAAVGSATQGALKASGVDAGDVIAIAIDTTSCTVVALDGEGRPLRPSMIWMDVRAAREAADVAASGDPALRINGGGAGPVSAEWMIPKALWLKRHQPEVFERAARICEYQDYLNWRCTGRWVASLDNVSIRWHYQSAHGGWPISLLARMGLEALQEKWPREVLAPGEIVGGLTREAAAHMGLRPDTPVVQGGADAFIGMIGLGVTEPGELALITGSSHLQLGVAEREVHKAGVWGTYQGAVYPGKPILEGGQTSTGSVIAWFKRNFAPHLSYDELNAAAGAIPFGAEGLIVSDHFQGNRTPHTDPLARGAITGLTLSHTPAHVYRAIVEGVCFGTRLIVDTFGSALPASRVVAAGGATNSPFWLQTHADTLGVSIQLTEVSDACALGSAVLAAAGVKRFASIEEGARAMVRVRTTIDPDPRAVEAYAPIYARYRSAYDALKPLRETHS